MPERQDVVALAAALGQALAAHPAVRAHRDAQHAVQTDSSAQKLLMDYQTHMGRLRQLEAEQKPIEVADKRHLRELEAQMAGHESLKALMRTQADYVALMTQVNSAIDGPLGEYAAPEPRE
jgi:cell fate (sporulation/competence/biofilm development) regulator YlbF (YheA/YmcA/DUF963 family)